jgi:hypothetical protein
MDANVPRDRRVLPVRLVQQVNKDLQDLQARVENLENRALRENQALQALLDRLESVVASAGQFWLQRTTLLKWMIIILGLIVLDRLLLHSPQIVEIVKNLL